jgi:hypothetical protein
MAQQSAAWLHANKSQALQQALMMLLTSLVCSSVVLEGNLAMLLSLWLVATQLLPECWWQLTCV